jgi:hypothetical protein
MKAYKRLGSTLNLGTRWKCVKVEVLAIFTSGERLSIIITIPEECLQYPIFMKCYFRISYANTNTKYKNTAILE